MFSKNILATTNPVGALQRFSNPVFSAANPVKVGQTIFDYYKMK